MMANRPVQTKQAATPSPHKDEPATSASSKYERLARPSQRLIDVSAALHKASVHLGLFKTDRD